MVVIAVIGILASVVLASLNSARGKSRDARRMADIKQLQIALELYFNDNGTYPNTGGWRDACASFGSFGVTGSNGYVPNLAPTYIPVLPEDPKPIPPSACYIYYSNTIDYKILVYNTVETNTASVGSTFYDPMRGGAIYTVYSPGGISF